MTPPPLPFRLVSGLILLALGGLAIRDMCLAKSDRMLPHAFGALIFLGPALITLALLLLMRISGAGRKICTRRNVIATGLLVVGIGAGSFFLSIATDNGGDASWFGGMFAVAAVICVALPGVLLILAGYLIKKEER